LGHFDRPSLMLTNKCVSLSAAGPPTEQPPKQRCLCWGLLHPQKPLSGWTSTRNLQDPFIRPFTQKYKYMHRHTYTHYTALLINPEITKPITTTLHLIRNYLKHFPIRFYTLIKKDHHASGPAHGGTSVHKCV